MLSLEFGNGVMLLADKKFDFMSSGHGFLQNVFQFSRHLPDHRPSVKMSQRLAHTLHRLHPSTTPARLPTFSSIGFHLVVINTEKVNANSVFLVRFSSERDSSVMQLQPAPFPSERDSFVMQLQPDPVPHDPVPQRIEEGGADGGHKGGTTADRRRSVGRRGRDDRRQHPGGSGWRPERRGEERAAERRPED